LKVAIVILNWNGKEHLKKYLPYVIEFTDRTENEIIVADNGSTDDSLAFLSKNFPEIRIIKLGQNYGFAGGYNRALEQVDADVFCILNSDARVTKDWLSSVIKVFESDEKIAAVQPKILSDRDCSMFEHAGAAGGFVDKYGYPFCRGRIMNIIEHDNGQYNLQTDIFWASGACLFIRSDVFKNAGGFDDDYFAHMEEIDLCWRLKNQGYRIVYCYQTQVFHWGGATLDYNNPHKLFLNFRNSLWTLYKNYTGKTLHWILFKRKIIDTLAIVKYLMVLDFKNMVAVIRAHLAYYRSKPLLREKRAELKEKVTKTKHIEMLDRSIVWQFFFFSRKVYSDFKAFRMAIRNTSPDL
jgi:GT2 family glycosyltransferase